MLILKKLLFTSLNFLLLGQGLYAMPSIGKFVHGDILIEETNDRMTLIVSGASSIEWEDFSLNADEILEIILPSSTSTVEFSVSSTLPSFIQGKIYCNGNIIINNPVGFALGKEGEIHSHSFSVNTRFQDEAFNKSAQLIQNDGKICCEELVLLIGQLKNNGLIEGHTVRVQCLDNVKRDTSIKNDGIIRAASSGTILLQANKGIISHFNRIESGQGTIIIEGQNIWLHSDSVVDASGDRGGGQIFIGGGKNGMDEKISNAAYVQVDAGAQILADALVSGDGGTIVVWADELNTFNGITSAAGSGPDGNDGEIDT